MHRNIRIRDVLLILAIFSLICYLVYHTINGERGIISLIKLSGDKEVIQKELEEIRAERMAIEHKVNLLRPDSLDLDLLDEQARKILGVAKQSEDVYNLN